MRSDGPFPTPAPAMAFLRFLADHQWIAALIVLGLAACACERSARIWRALLRSAAAVGRRPAAACVLAGLLAAAGSATVALALRFPQPRVHDEFSYLLAADTFASGRLTNPTHPHWEHFETFHVIHQPSYQSKFHPGQGLALAAGQRLAGHPVVGLWLQALLFGASLAWMLLAWLPRRWAVLGAALGVVHLGIVTYWTQSYWGGALAAAGGALVYGALPRVLASARAGDAALLGTGLGLLAITRPFEGLVVSLPAAAVLASRLLRHLRRGEQGVAARVVVALMLPLALFLGGLAVYHRAVTGDAFLFPYAVHDQRYAMLSPFLFIRPFAVEAYRHDVIRDFWSEFGLGHWRAQQSWTGYLSALAHRGEVLWSFFLGPYLCLPLLGLPWARSRRGARLAAAVLGCLGLALLAMTYRIPHYAAPATSLLLLLVVHGARQVSLLRPRARPLGAALLLGSFSMLLAQRGGQALRDGLQPEGWHEGRAAMQRELGRGGRRSLVIVEYGPRHDFHEEWVYNAADIDSSPVVWARGMGREADARLVASFADRQVLLLRLGFEGEDGEPEPYSP